VCIDRLRANASGRQRMGTDPAAALNAEMIEKKVIKDLICGQITMARSERTCVLPGGSSSCVTPADPSCVGSIKVYCSKLQIGSSGIARFLTRTHFEFAVDSRVGKPVAFYDLDAAARVSSTTSALRNWP